MLFDFFLNLPKPALYFLVRLKIALLSLILPVSVIHVLYSVCFRQHTFRSYFIAGLELLACIEIVFYFLYLFHWKRLSHKRPHEKSVYKQSSQKRKELFLQCTSSIDDIEKFLSGWFLGSSIDEIYSDNLKEFLAWAFLSEDYKDLEQGVNSSFEDVRENAISDLLELEWMKNYVKEKYNIKLKDGRNPSVKCMRLTLDKLKPLHKPFFYYALIYLLECVFTLMFRHVPGFRKYHSRGEQELLAFWGNDCPDHMKVNRTKVSYWYRPAASARPNQKPLVFVHGIGVGLFAYFTFFTKLWAQIDSPIFVVELPHVLSRLFPFYKPVIEDVPSDIETVLAIESMLKRHSITEDIGATFVGHSLGSTVVTWMIKHRPSLVKRAIFVDPVVFLLFYPDVAYNFVYRKPVDTASWLIWWFCSRELYISWTLHRCFYWHQSLLTPNEIPSTVETSVVFGGQDCVIPGYEILKKMKEAGAKQVDISKPLPNNARDRIRLYFYPGLNHAEFLFRSKEESDIVRIILGHEPTNSNESEEEIVDTCKDSAYDSEEELIKKRRNSLRRIAMMNKEK